MPEAKRTALITGAASGIGRAIAQQLAAAGHRVVLADLDLAGATELAQSLGDKATALQLDITDRARVDDLPNLVPPVFRPIDILVNNAGHDIGGRTRFDLGKADDWSSIIDTNLNGLMRVTRAMLPGMVQRNSGDIVNISSISAIRLVPDMAAYTASKAGVRAFTDILRREPLQTGELQRMQEGMPFPTLETLDGYRTLLNQSDCTVTQVDDLSQHWAQILVQRLAMYRSLESDTVRKFGAEHFRKWDETYAYFVGLFREGKLGGGRFVARKTQVLSANERQ